MFLFKGLHSLAAPRGDGLRREILELFAEREALGAANAEELSTHRAGQFCQAGPNPVGRLATTAENVVPFRKTKQNDI